MFGSEYDLFVLIDNVYCLILLLLMTFDFLLVHPGLVCQFLFLFLFQYLLFYMLRGGGINNLLLTKIHSIVNLLNYK